MNNLLRFDEKQLYLVIDMETCNVNLLQDNYPWQLGFIIANNREVLEKHDYYIYWEDINDKISPGAKKHTKFNYDAYIRAAQDQFVVLNKLETYLYDPQYIIVGHNIFNFDIFIHNQWRKLNNLNPNWSYIHRAIDTDALARAWKIGVKHFPRNNWPVSMFKYGNYKEKGMRTNLTSLGKEFGINYDYDNLHHALNDVMLNYIVFQQLVYKIDI